MKLKLPPVIVFLVFGSLMYLLAEFLPVGDFDFFGRSILIKTLLVLAVVISSVALLQFYLAKTTADPKNLAKASSLVSNGVYKYSRNPMYLGLLLILLAWALWLGNAFNVLLAAGFVSYMNAFQIQPEESTLASLFGKEYNHYFIKVRRWF
ncbi:MAG: isoprenylcysteine carboxylmethyltransferase family protein [Eudoraea sp.]|uniref:methyltransferase family protein n=1 Tax=Eudoraea sp. TaxID=1979955 RepID=UPI003C77FDD4